MALTDEELYSLSTLKQPEWAQGPMAEILARHKVPFVNPETGKPTTPAEAADFIERTAAESGAGQSAWANPQEWAAAREEYARQGRTPAEVEKRWSESIYLLDPRTREYMQKYGRDADFLQAAAKWKPDEQPAFYAGMSPSGPANFAAHASNEALDFYNNSKDNPLYRSGVANANYQRFGGAANGLVNAVTNPDTAAGNYMTFSETVPNFLRMQGSGETDTARESWQAAQAQRLASNRYRAASPAPILDLPDGASPQDISRRIAELQKQVASASVPQAEERWQRTTGWTPPGFMADAGDFAMSMVDPTIMLPALKGAGAATSVAGAVSKGSRLAPALRMAAGPVAKDAAWDMGVEQAAGAGIVGAIGGVPGRSTMQYAAGMGTPGSDFTFKGDDELADAKSTRGELYDRLKDDDGVSTAERDAYNRLANSGVLLDPVERERRDRQFQPKF